MPKEKKPEMSKFNVVARVYAEVSVQIEAQNLEDALTKSKEMKVYDFIAVEGDEFDSNHRVTQIFESRAEVKL